MALQKIWPDAILFDLDGTLLDTAPDLGHALNRVLSDHNRPLKTHPEMRPYASHGSYGLLKLGFGDDFNDTNRLQLRQQFLDYYEARVCVDTSLFVEVALMLERLNKLGLPVAIVTNKPTLYTELVLQQIPTLAEIQVVVCGDTLAVAKPHPAPLLHACQLLSTHHDKAIDPQQCLYVGDAERDIVAGRDAGMRTVLASYGYIAPEDQASSWRADYTITSPAKLLDLLLES
ncbi:haloacid dehalogenase superfamily enzyme, subfamily IA [Idiomarina sp. A28L]|uniref:HAD family hydrolase n=1 Tax=Idiomarina sp. A28L TaxID=1036674 RepID=UPI00021388BE|nr:HAD-IA family hydrolase [Idiomarina sp. A28L]EGN74939.1 haloacid dehalogenase superfamily enzyme, subfamily IA [Idiomarina sp. A28L]